MTARPQYPHRRCAGDALPQETAYSSGGPFIDGYASAIARVAFTTPTPESPRQLLSKGRPDDVGRSIKKVYGPGYGMADPGP